jgi:hypothetical protein
MPPEAPVIRARQLRESQLYGVTTRLFPDDELVLLMQSRSWQEEPDLMAVDKDGNLYIFGECSVKD